MENPETVPDQGGEPGAVPPATDPSTPATPVAPGEGDPVPANPDREGGDVPEQPPTTEPTPEQGSAQE
jgi:hypothetical protein